MKITLYQVDAFASRTFEGNPAAVCPLDHWLSDNVLQAIAEENNLSETAFFVPTHSGFQLRWFTPVAEVDLCGHATLATAHILFTELNYSKPEISFETRSDELIVFQRNNKLVMNFPSNPPLECPAPAALVEGLGAEPTTTLVADDYIAVFDSEADIRVLTPKFTRLCDLDRRGVIVTAPGNDLDFVSRFFAPKLGINEDPVTGSAHCELMPYWCNRLGNASLTARQISKRGGDLDCELHGDRITLAGTAVTFMKAEIKLNE